MPGGSGKAVVIAFLIYRIFNMWANQRILQIVHTKELVEQNDKKLKVMWPEAPSGVYCAGLDQKDIAQPIIFGSLGSVRNNIEAFGHRDLLVVDECHCLSPDEETGYQKIIAGLTEINPNLRVVGLTATDYRLGQGKLTNDGLFTDVCFDITSVSSFNRLIAEGYLAPLIPKRTDISLDVSEVSITKGDYNQGKLQKAVDKEEITYAALQEALRYGSDRHCWIVFASGIEHCEHIADMLQSFGIDAACVHSKMSNDERDKRLNAFKRGEIKAIVGFRVLTTGFDHPPIDLIIDLYPTVSPGMHVQKYSRGTRPYDCRDSSFYISGFEYVKSNCLVLDFACNCKRLGPINDPIIPRKKGDKVGEAPIKICEAINNGETCGIYNHASARYCGGKPYPSDEGCGAEFIFKTKLIAHAGTEEVIRGEAAIVETVDVDRVIYHRHSKIGSQPSIKVTYYSGLAKYTEWVCLEAIGKARTRAVQWWLARHASEPPATTDDALCYVSQLRVPKRIRVRTDQKFIEILGVEW